MLPTLATPNAYDRPHSLWGYLQNDLLPGLRFASPGVSFPVMRTLEQSKILGFFFFTLVLYVLPDLVFIETNA
jgi:hypothetical protein